MNEPLKPGDTIEVQISPFGNFANLKTDPRYPGWSEPVEQICDREAFEDIVRNFKPEVLVDVDHVSEEGGSTKAAAWVQSLRVDANLGLMGVFKLTELGADLLNGREYRFLSPAWILNDQNAKASRPTFLTSIAITNKPNLPVRPLVNLAPGMSNPNNNGGSTPPQPKRSIMLEQLKTLLGLAPEADDAAVLAAVKAQKDALDTATAAAINAEAEAAANTHNVPAKNREAFVKAYAQNPEAVKAALNSIGTIKTTAEPIAPPARVTNSAAAKPPPPVALNRLQEYDAMPPGRDKRAFLAKNAAEINRLRVEAKKAEG